MPRPKPAITRVPVLIRFDPDALILIDARRGDLTRAQFIERAVIGKALMPQAKPISTKPLVDIDHPKPISSIGPVKPKPGALLKNR